MKVDLWVGYILMVILMTLTLMQGRSGSAEERIQLWIISTFKQAIQNKTCSNVLMWTPTTSEHNIIHFEKLITFFLCFWRDSNSGHAWKVNSSWTLYPLSRPVTPCFQPKVGRGKLYPPVIRARTGGHVVRFLVVGRRVASFTCLGQQARPCFCSVTRVAGGSVVCRAHGLMSWWGLVNTLWRSRRLDVWASTFVVSAGRIANIFKTIPQSES